MLRGSVGMPRGSVGETGAEGWALVELGELESWAWRARSPRPCWPAAVEVGGQREIVCSTWEWERSGAKRLLVLFFIYHRYHHYNHCRY